MPTYCYRCSRCEHEFETYQGVKDLPLKRCPECRKHSLERILYATRGRVAGQTLGSLAEKNTKEMGSKLDTPETKRLLEAKAKKREYNRINKMTEAQKLKYISEG
jgi:putative FmdB family regulatory protein